MGRLSPPAFASLTQQRYFTSSTAHMCAFSIRYKVYFMYFMHAAAQSQTSHTNYTVCGKFRKTTTTFATANSDELLRYGRVLVYRKSERLLGFP